jgi:hypothetical protein
VTRPSSRQSQPSRPVTDPTQEPGFQGYDAQNRPIFAHYNPDGSIRGYSDRPQPRGG